MTEIPEQKIQNFPESELEKLTKYLKNDQKKLAISQMIKNCDAAGLTQLVFSNETNDGVGSFRGKFIETILFSMIYEAVQTVNGEGTNMLFMQHPYYCGGNRYGQEIDAVFAFYQTQQVYKMLQELQARNKCITCKIGNRIKA